MSNWNKYRQRPQSLSLGEASEARLKELIKQQLERGIHGIAFSPYTNEQQPGCELTDSQIESRLRIVAPYVSWIRVFSCTDGNERIPAIAKKLGIKTLVGVWLDNDLENNQEEIDNAVHLARDGLVDLMAVGNEVLLRGELSEAQLVNYIHKVKDSTPNIPVGYVDAYFKFEEHPAVAQASDVIFTNCYPFWEGYPLEHALVYMKDMYHRASRVADGKPVIISETGWPDKGSAERGAIPSRVGAMRYFLESQYWVKQDNIDMFYFSSFDENWKVADEGDVGAYWGLWNSEGEFKYA